MTGLEKEKLKEEHDDREETFEELFEAARKYMEEHPAEDIEDIKNFMQELGINEEE